ncbi:acid phosphatase [Lipomyces oligophaga]|uniref:acid phosphatase n=1 Tax=Lipomyces oligophaga TaxID=45792 RepID=UPI0034CDCE21
MVKSALIFSLALAGSVIAAPWVDTRYDYTGPDVPIGDWVDQTINGNGKGFARLYEPPAVKPGYSNPTNNINVIQTSFLPDGMNVRFQTPFGLGRAPAVKYGTSKHKLSHTAYGSTITYDRTPSCGLTGKVTMCSEFFHDVQITNLEAGTTYYYQIQAANGTTESDVLTFTTGKSAGDDSAFTVAVICDLGYTFANGTYKYLVEDTEADEFAFAWHGGDLSYADDWAYGIEVCNGGTTSHGEQPASEVNTCGGPNGGDVSSIYETNWDLWQQWMNNVTKKIPYMVMPGNHEDACTEDSSTVIAAYLDDDIINGSASSSAISYFSCPPSQRNFTAFQNRFRMPGPESGGVSNFWYSFDYGLAHFISFDGETDYANAPQWTLQRLAENRDTTVEDLARDAIDKMDAGPFGAINGSDSENESFEQWNFIKNDLANVDRSKTPWIIAMSHRPMYSSQTGSALTNMRTAFEDMFIEYGVDLYISGHIHWYERFYPMAADGVVDDAAYIDYHTYRTKNGTSMAHVVNGMAGNIENHSTLGTRLNISLVLNNEDYGFSKLKIVNSTAMYWEYVMGTNGTIGDYLWLVHDVDYTTTHYVPYAKCSTSHNYLNVTDVFSNSTGYFATYEVDIPNSKKDKSDNCVWEVKITSPSTEILYSHNIKGYTDKSVNYYNFEHTTAVKVQDEGNGVYCLNSLSMQFDYSCDYNSLDIRNSCDSGSNSPIYCFNTTSAYNI